MNFEKLVAQYTLDAALIVKFDSAPGILYANKAFFQLFGYSVDELGSLSPWRLLSQSALTSKLDLGFSFNLDHTTVLDAKGQPMLVDIYLNPVLEENAENCWSLVLRPAQEKKQFQDSLLRIADQLKLIVDSAPLLIWSIDTTGQLKFAEGSLLKSLNLSKEEIIGASLFEVFTLYPEFLESVRRNLDSSAPTIDCTGLGPITLETHFTKLSDSTGEPLGLMGVSIDVSDRIIHQQIQTQLNSVLEATSDIVTLTNESEILYINQAAQTVLGYPDASSLVSLSSLYPKEAFEFMQHTAYVYAKKHGLWTGETSLISKEGRLIPISLVLVAHKAQDNTVRYFSMIARDISAIKETERKLREAKEKAEAAAATKAEFLANMSHEIRTPLNGIIGFADLLSKETDPESIAKYTTAIKRSGKNLLRLLTDILDLSKIESGFFQLQPEPINPSDFLSEMETLFSVECSKKGLNLDLKLLPEHQHNILLDISRLRQVLFNLIGNAIKYTQKGQVALVYGEAPGASSNHFNVMFQVKDTGLGVSEKDQEAIFEPFTQKHNPAGGVGLGLSITKKLVIAMGGTLSLKSELGQGSTFTVEFHNVPATLQSPMPSQVAVREQIEQEAKSEVPTLDLSLLPESLQERFLKAKNNLVLREVRELAQEALGSPHSQLFGKALLQACDDYDIQFIQSALATLSLEEKSNL